MWHARCSSRSIAAPGRLPNALFVQRLPAAPSSRPEHACEEAMFGFVDVPMLDPMERTPWRGPLWLRRIKEDIRCVRLRDPAARGEFETLLTYPGVHAVIWHRM